MVTLKQQIWLCGPDDLEEVSKKIAQSCKARAMSFVTKAWKMFLGYWYFVRTWGQKAQGWYKTGWGIGGCKRKGGRIKVAHQENHYCKGTPDRYAEVESICQYPRENTKVTEKWGSETLGEIFCYDTGHEMPCLWEVMKKQIFENQAHPGKWIRVKPTRAEVSQIAMTYRAVHCC